MKPRDRTIETPQACTMPTRVRPELGWPFAAPHPFGQALHLEREASVGERGREIGQGLTLDHRNHSIFCEGPIVASGECPALRRHQAVPGRVQACGQTGRPAADYDDVVSHSLH